MRLHLRATPGAAREARAAARAFARDADIGETLIASVLLCVSEAVSNVVLHAYREGSEVRGVELEMLAARGGLNIRVCDHGAGIRPDNDTPGAGYGLSIIRDLTSAMTVTSGAGTQVDMWFDATPLPGTLPA